MKVALFVTYTTNLQIFNISQIEPVLLKTVAID
jgi:hypothetical protein